MNQASTASVSRRHLVIVSALMLVLAAQAGWSIATTSGTYDETTYLGFGRAAYHTLDTKPLADWGVAMGALGTVWPNGDFERDDQAKTLAVSSRRILSSGKATRAASSRWEA